MKTLALDDKLYSALEEYSEETGRPVSDLAAEAIKSWLLDDELDEAELAETRGHIAVCKRASRP